MLAKEPTWFSMDGQTIEVVREFGYLGQAGTNTGQTFQQTSRGECDGQVQHAM